MSTRSAIIRKTEQGYEGVYCHNDGYPDGVGAQLLKHYNNEKSAAAIVGLGYLSSLHKKLRPAPGKLHSFACPQRDVTVAYGRDRGETGVAAVKGKTIKSVADQIGHNGYVYVWKGGQWRVNGCPLVDVISGKRRAGCYKET